MRSRVLQRASTGQSNNNQAGFSAINLGLMLVIVVLIGAVGWLVYRDRHQSVAVTTNSINHAQKITQTVKPAASDPTASWRLYSSKLGKFSLRYPASWTQPPAQDDCQGTAGDSILYLGADPQAPQSCDSQMYIDAKSGNQIAADTPTNDPMSGYMNVVTTAVTIDGVTGTRSTATTTMDHPGHKYTPGSKIIQYVFYTNGMTYRAQYLQNPQGSNGFTQDVSSDFDLMITKTLKFSS